MHRIPDAIRPYLEAELQRVGLLGTLPKLERMMDRSPVSLPRFLTTVCRQVQPEMSFERGRGVAVAMLLAAKQGLSEAQYRWAREAKTPEVVQPTVANLPHILEALAPLAQRIAAAKTFEPEPPEIEPEVPELPDLTYDQLAERLPNMVAPPAVAVPNAVRLPAVSNPLDALAGLNPETSVVETARLPEPGAVQESPSPAVPPPVLQPLEPTLTETETYTDPSGRVRTRLVTRLSRNQ